MPLRFRTVAGCLLIVVFYLNTVPAPLLADQARQQAYLRQLLAVLPPDRPGSGPVTPLDATWRDWEKRTGELPPDFAAMPSLPLLPNPLVLDEGRRSIPVKTTAQWLEQRAWIQREIEHWITGTFPPPPHHIRARVLRDAVVGRVRVKTVELRFGPRQEARMTIELYQPPGRGRFPVFMTPGADGSSWISIGPAVKRGYIGCLYGGCDAKDDTEAYARIWYPRYDFTRLMRRAWGAGRVIDFLCTLPEVDTNRIALAGLSRDGKQTLMAAAFEPRITAAVVCSGGTGGENPFRYTSEKFNNESIAEITANFPNWLHPRLRFFVGREQKLPVDQNCLAALVAPRGLLLSSSIFESQGDPWGIEQNYLATRRVYRFLGAAAKLGLDLRHGYHPPAIRDVERFVDFTDYVFGRSRTPPVNRLYYNYSFARWQGLSGERVDPASFPARGIDDLLRAGNGKAIHTLAQWERKKQAAQSRIRWGLGEQPPVPPVGPGFHEDYLRAAIGQPRFRGFGSKDIAFGTLFFSADASGGPAKPHLPIVIYLHEYAYPTGYARRVAPILRGFLDRGFGVYVYDQIGFGTRIEEGTRFYERYPHWSKLGCMVADAQAAVSALQRVGFVDPQRIYAAGYSLGATVALYTAALDDRIAGAISVCGFTPMRLATPDKGMEGVRAYSHLHGLLPRLGFFVGDEPRLPYDFHEILACIAPRPILVIAPRRDRDANFDDVRHCVEEARKIYRLFGAADSLELFAPDDYNRFTPAMQARAFDWMQATLNHQPN